MTTPLTRGLSCLTLAAALAGCSAHFPYGRSMDKHNFVSDAHMPKTVLLIDSVTRQEVIRWDVPVGKKLVVDLEHEGDWTSSLYVADPPYKVTWVILDAADKLYSPDQQYTMDLPGHPVYFRVYDTRNAPPAPEPSAPAAEPVPPPAPQPRPTPTDQQPPTEQTQPATAPDQAQPQPVEHQPGPPTTPASGKKYPLDEILEKAGKSPSDTPPPAQPPAGQDLQPDQPK